MNPSNPRKIQPDKLEKLMRSIESFPEMMKLRPMVYDPETMYVLGGNQRLAAIRKLGMKEITGHLGYRCHRSHARAAEGICLAG